MNTDHERLWTAKKQAGDPKKKAAKPGRKQNIGVVVKSTKLSSRIPSGRSGTNGGEANLRL
jgi:hypothetical protein